MTSAGPSALSRFRSRPRSPWISTVLLGLVFVLLWANLFALPKAALWPSLDPSWCGALIRFSALKLQFGKDVIFTYGPLGHLVSFVYTGELFTARVIWEYASKTLFAAILCAAIVSLPRLWRLPFFLFVLLFIWIDPISDALYFLVITCVTALLFRYGASRISLNALAGALFAICSLIKFTYCILGVFALLLLASAYLRNQGRSSAITLAVSFVSALLLSWILAGQALANLPSFLLASFDVSLGYKDAMGLPAENEWVVVIGLIAALLAFAQCGLIFWQERRLPTLCLALFYAGETFLSWNRAFVRADDHVLSFFALCPVALMTLWIAATPRGTIKVVAYAVNALIALVCLAGIYVQRPAAITGSLSDAVSRITETLRVGTAPGATARRLQAELIEARNEYSLPRVRAAVGKETIDVFGYEQGMALLNDLNYTPRPVFQGYSAYTPRLIAMNTAFYSSSRAPAFVLLKYQPIDDRYPTLEDAGVLRQLLLYYKPLFMERGYTLWKRVSEPKPTPPSISVTQSLVFDEIFTLPNDKNTWVELDVRQSLRGRLLDFLYKPPPVEIHVNDSEGGQTIHRLIPRMSSAGFIINPPLTTERDLFLSALGGFERSTVSFLVHVPKTSRRFFQRRVTTRVASLPDLPIETADRASRIEKYTNFFREDGPVLQLTEVFRASSEILLKAGPLELDGFSAGAGVELTATPGGLMVRAEGQDPQLILPKFSPPPGRNVVVRIDLETATDSSLLLFYNPPGKNGFDDPLMKRCVSISRRKNAVYFELNEATLGGSLHLDPGDYLITGFEIRSLPVAAETR